MQGSSTHTLSHKWDILSIVGIVLYFDIVTLFGGSLQYKRGIFGVSYRTFDFQQRLTSGEHPLVQYRSLRKHAHMRDMCSEALREPRQSDNIM